MFSLLMSPKRVISRSDLGVMHLTAGTGNILCGKPGNLWDCGLPGRSGLLVGGLEGGIYFRFCFCFWPQLSASCPSKMASVSHSRQPGTTLFLPPCLPGPRAAETVSPNQPFLDHIAAVRYFYHRGKEGSHMGADSGTGRVGCAFWLLLSCPHRTIPSFDSACSIQKEVFIYLSNTI